MSEFFLSTLVLICKWQIELQNNLDETNCHELNSWSWVISTRGSLYHSLYVVMDLKCFINTNFFKMGTRSFESVVWSYNYSLSLGILFTYYYAFHWLLVALLWNRCLENYFLIRKYSNIPPVDQVFLLFQCTINHSTSEIFVHSFSSLGVSLSIIFLILFFRVFLFFSISNCSSWISVLSFLLITVRRYL